MFIFTGNVSRKMKTNKQIKSTSEKFLSIWTEVKLQLVSYYPESDLLVSYYPCQIYYDSGFPGGQLKQKHSGFLSPSTSTSEKRWPSLWRKQIAQFDRLTGQQLSNLLSACRKWSWQKTSRWTAWRLVSLIFPSGKMEYLFTK